MYRTFDLVSFPPRRVLSYAPRRLLSSLVTSLFHQPFEHLCLLQTPKLGSPLPLPDTFDYVAWMMPPPDVDIPVLMDVKTRNKRNIVIDTFNSTSIDITRAYMEAAQDGTRAAGQDLETLVVDNDYFSLVSPVPPHVALAVFEERRARKKSAEEKKANDEKAKSKGLLKSLVMANPVQLSAASRPKFCSFLFATEHLFPFGGSLTPVSVSRRNNSAAKVSFVDITKLTKEWGGDDTTDLSADANDLNPHTYGGELEKHFAFFKNVDDAEELFD
ncbi:hypothetical protein B0H14DRAFT_3518746, partial [Mycena olivaceomarginata]